MRISINNWHKYNLKIQYSKCLGDWHNDAERKFQPSSRERPAPIRVKNGISKQTLSKNSNSNLDGLAIKLSSDG